MRVLLSSPLSVTGTPMHKLLAAWLGTLGSLSEVPRTEGYIEAGEGADADAFDLVVACMDASDGQALACELPARRLVVVPLLAGASEYPDAWWQQFQTHRFMTFSRRQHEQLLRAGLDSAYFQYFHSVEQNTPTAAPAAVTAAILWESAGSTWKTVALAARQCLTLGLNNLHVAGMIQQGAKSPGVQSVDVFLRAGLDIRIGNGGREHDDLACLFARHAVVILPEISPAEIPVLAMAMAMGRVVIAPDISPASDYLAHGISGLLYDPRAPLASLRPGGKREPYALPELAAAALAKAARGRTRWNEDTARLTSLLANDGKRWSSSDHSAGFGNLVRRRAGEAAAAFIKTTPQRERVVLRLDDGSRGGIPPDKSTVADPANPCQLPGEMC